MNKNQIAACKTPSELRALYAKEKPKSNVAACEFWINKIINHRKKKGYL
jgi:hypothetical protein